MLLDSFRTVTMTVAAERAGGESTASRARAYQPPGRVSQTE